VVVVDVLSSVLLGFGPDARVLIVNGDDFGMHEAVNAAVAESIENGIASSCSLMVPCPAAANAIRLLRERPHIPFGIHLSLIRDSPEYCWGPAASKADVPSLLDPGTEEFF
jgi:YdjC-like protein